MDLLEAIDTRFSCRSFSAKPVDADVVRTLIEGAARAASGGNLQPWRIYALTGQPLAELKRRVAAAIGDNDPRESASTEYAIYPKELWGPYKSRREEHGVQLYAALGIPREDKAGRLIQYKRNFEFFGAPVGLFIAIDRRFGPGQWADLGSYLHTLMYLARARGLDTCPQQSWGRVHGIVRDFVQMPPEQMLYCGVALGYSDPSQAVNHIRSPRAPVDEFCAFFGFDDMQNDGKTVSPSTQNR
ncbi:MAG: nitroreductase [Pseudorhodoplanes sp.]|nr:nitroreductase [Pseudorhodoplanes sp.]